MRLQELNRLMTMSTLNAREQKRKSQEQRILDLLLQAFPGEVPLPAILKLGIAQYSRAIHTLRRSGHEIANRSVWNDAGERHTFFRLKSRFARPVVSQAVEHGSNRTDNRSALRNTYPEAQPDLLQIPVQETRWQDPESLK
jgi:hypothetical protein